MWTGSGKRKREDGTGVVSVYVLLPTFCCRRRPDRRTSGTDSIAGSAALDSAEASVEAVASLDPSLGLNVVHAACSGEDCDAADCCRRVLPSRLDTRLTGAEAATSAASPAVSAAISPGSGCSSAGLPKRVSCTPRARLAEGCSPFSPGLTCARLGVAGAVTHTCEAAAVGSAEADSGLTCWSPPLDTCWSPPLASPPRKSSMRPLRSTVSREGGPARGHASVATVVGLPSCRRPTTAGNTRSASEKTASSAGVNGACRCRSWLHRLHCSSRTLNEVERGTSGDCETKRTSARGAPEVTRLYCNSL